MKQMKRGTGDDVPPSILAREDSYRTANPARRPRDLTVKSQGVLPRSARGPVREHVAQTRIELRPHGTRGKRAGRQLAGRNLQAYAEMVIADDGKPSGAQSHRVASAGLIEMARHRRRPRMCLIAGSPVCSRELAEVSIRKRGQVAVLTPGALHAWIAAVLDTAAVRHTGESSRLPLPPRHASGRAPRFSETHLQAWHAAVPADIAGVMRGVRLRNTAEPSGELSVGDLAGVGGTLLAVASAGWEPVTGPLTEVRTRQHGTSPLPLPRAPGQPGKEHHSE